SWPQSSDCSESACFSSRSGCRARCCSASCCSSRRWCRWPASTRRAASRPRTAGGRSAEAGEQAVELVEVAEADRQLARALAVGADLHGGAEPVGQLLLQAQQVAVGFGRILLRTRIEHAIDEM